MFIQQISLKFKFKFNFLSQKIAKLARNVDKNEMHPAPSQGEITQTAARKSVPPPNTMSIMEIYNQDKE
jgi:hypothetical protein